MKLKYNERIIKQHVLVTPEIAKEILRTHNERNRPFSRGYVEQFKEAIREGQFKEVNAITIDWNGNLLDGQHRLKAVVETGIPVYMTIIFGQDPDDFDLTNTGHAMTISEFAKTNEKELGGKVQTVMYSAASVVKHLMDEKSPRGHQIPKRKLKQFIKENLETFEFMSSQKRGKPAYMYNKSILNAIEFLLYTKETEENKKKVALFFNNLWNMRTDSTISPVEKAYATWIGNQPHTGVSGEISTIIGTYCAWKAFKAGKRIQKLRTDCTLSDFIREVVEKA